MVNDEEKRLEGKKQETTGRLDRGHQAKTPGISRVGAEDKAEPGPQSPHVQIKDRLLSLYFSIVRLGFQQVIGSRAPNYTTLHSAVLPASLSYRSHHQ